MGKELSPKIKVKRTVQVGRGMGSGHGKTAGRGHKGHKQRAGYHIMTKFEGGQMPLLQRLPKHGFTNAKHTRDMEAVTVKIIAEKYQEGEKVSMETLHQKKVISKVRKKVKIILKGELTKKLEFDKELFFSKQAKEHVEKSGSKLV